MPANNPARAALSRAVNKAIAEGSPVFVNQPAPQRVAVGGNSGVILALSAEATARIHARKANSTSPVYDAIAGADAEMIAVGMPTYSELLNVALAADKALYSMHRTNGVIPLVPVAEALARIAQKV